MRNVDAPPVAMLTPRPAPRRPLFLPRVCLRFFPPRADDRDEFAGLETDDKWFFVLSGHAVAAAGRLIGAVTRVTDVARVFSHGEENRELRGG